MEQAVEVFFNNFPYGLAILSKDRIVAVNSKMAEMFGKSIDEIKGEDISQWLYIEEGELKEILEEVVNKKKHVQLKGKLKADKEMLNVYITFFPVEEKIFALLQERKEIKEDEWRYVVHRLKERLKELSCLHAIEIISRKNASLEKILEEIASIAGNILQHSELAYCRIILRGKEYSSSNYKKTNLMLSADIIIDGRKEGTIEIGYIMPVPSEDGKIFFEEEKKALQHIAMRIANIVEYMEAKEELRKSREYFQMLVEESSDIIMVIDENATIEYISPSIKKILGFSPEEVVGRSALEFVHPEDLETAMSKFEETLNKPAKVVSTIFRASHKNGGWRMVEVKGRNLMDNPVVRGIIINFHDITEIFEKEKRIMEKERKLRALINAAHDLVLLAKTDGTILDLNEAMAKAIGRKREEIIGTNVEEYKKYLPPSIYEKRIENAKKVEKTKKPVRFIDHGGKRWFDNCYYPIFDEKGKVVEIAVFARDITDLKEAEERFEQVVENANEWIWEVDVDGIYTYSSSAVEKILGYKPREIVGKKRFYELFHPEDKEKLKEEAFRIFKNKEPFRNFLNRNIHKNGEERWLLTSGVPIFDVRGNLKGYRGLDLDITELKKAQKEIEKLNEYLKSIIENANVWLDVLDAEGNVVIWNRAAEEISGYKKEEVIGHAKIWEWLYPDEEYKKKIFEKAMAIIERGEVVENFETVIRTKNGERKIISWYSKRIIDKDGNIVGSVALGRDVTKQREIEKLTKTLINATHDLMLLIKKDGTILNLNDAMARAFGKKREEIIGKNVREFLPPDVYERRVAKVKEMKRKKKPVRFIDFRNGRWFDNHLYPIFDENGNVVEIAVFVRDITEERKFEMEARKFKTIADNANYGVVIFDMDGRISYANECFAAAHGYKAKEIVGKNIALLSSKHQSLLNLKDEIVKRGYFTAEIYQRKKNGSEFPMLASGTLIEDEQNPPYIAVTAIDITERKQIEERLIQQKRLASLGRLAAVVAHELNTPLANIAITTQYLMEKMKDFREELEVIRKEVENASSIIEDVLNFSRMKIRERKEVDIREIVEKAIERVRRVYPADDIIFQNRIKECRIIGDEQRLLECFVNIIKNAVMAKDEKKKSHYVIIDASIADDMIEVKVRDNGVGMDEEVKKEALKPFFTTRPMGEGTGLGLFIANWVAEEHGGGIKIKSKKGEGTEVMVKIRR